MFAELLCGGDVKPRCAALYAHPAVRWLLGDELHPGGEATTRRALELIAVEPGERLLDIASGKGDSARLAARERGCVVTGIDYGEAAVIDATREGDAAGIGDRIAFRVGDAEALPVEDQTFDAVLCECSLCTFPDKPRALAEMRRVLRPGGRLAIADVIADHDRLPASLSGPLATAACVGSALGCEELQRLLASSGFHVLAIESCTREAGEMAERVHDRLRGARIVGADRIVVSALAIEEAIAMAVAAREAIANGSLDYAIFAAAR
ncbi:MAG: class I SAM-dependent methyltransferase [Solirubrobacteraceae bacterium]